jgi:hypothetical protein
VPDAARTRLCLHTRYIDRTHYIKTQPPADRKKGFYSSDASRRDEFTLDIETEKWRERIATEMMFAERFAKRREEEMTPEERQKLEELARTSMEPRWTHGPAYLFDLGKEATGGTTPYEMKDARDTWYSKHRVKTEDGGQRNCGGICLSSHAYGDNLKGFNSWEKPEFARQPIIRDSFFRSTGTHPPRALPAHWSVARARATASNPFAFSGGAVRAGVLRP